MLNRMFKTTRNRNSTTTSSDQKMKQCKGGGKQGLGSGVGWVGSLGCAVRRVTYVHAGSTRGTGELSGSRYVAFNTKSAL